MKAEVLADEDVLSINVDDHNKFISCDHVMIGFLTRSVMTSRDTLPQEKCRITEKCRCFMVEAYKYAMSHLPIHDPVLKHAEIAQFSRRRIVHFESLEFFVERFSPLKANVEGSMDVMFDQFSEYQSLQNGFVDELKCIDQMWHYLGNLQGCDGFRFNFLYEVVKYILLLPHSNADEERIFSLIAKNKAKFRASLSNETSLPSILSSKVNCFNYTACYKFEPSQSLIENAKRATGRYNADHSGQS